jgi:signal transduction histidine kinase
LLAAGRASGQDVVGGLVGFSSAIALGYTVVGAALHSRDPGNRLAVVLLAIGTSRAAYVAATAWADDGTRTGAGTAAWLSFWLPFVAVSLTPLTLLWFPDGALPDGRRRWRWAQTGAPVALAGVGAIAAASLSSRGPGLLDETALPTGAAGVVLHVGFVMSLLPSLAGLVAGVYGLYRRWRAHPVTLRKQITWYAAGVVVAVLLNGIGDLVSGGGVLNLLGTLAFLTCLLVAVTRHDLWDIDRLLQRTVVYGSLSAILAAVYVVAVLAAGLLLEGVSQHSALAVATATLATASSAGPVRRALQLRVDRRFDRRTYDAVARVLEHDRNTSLTAPEPGQTEALLRDVLHDPDLSVVYSCRNGMLVDAWGSPVAGPAPAPGQGWTVTTHDPVAWSSVERAAGPVLTRCRLQAELLVQVADAESSRRRVVAAGDLERRRIERNLHDGAQQRLVSLALRLRTAQRKRAAPAGDAGARLIDETVDELRAAVEDLRSLAAGLLPGALVSEGLAAALQEMVGRQPTPVRLTIALDHRHAESLDEVAWFVALEALTNVVKHAHAGCVTLGVSCDGNSLMLSVSDDGAGGATEGPGLTGLRDRVHASEGQLLLRSPAGAGTTVTVALPCG